MRNRIHPTPAGRNADRNGQQEYRQNSESDGQQVQSIRLTALARNALGNRQDLMRPMWIFQHRICIMGVMCREDSRMQMHEAGVPHAVLTHVGVDERCQYLQADEPKHDQPCWKFQMSGMHVPCSFVTKFDVTTFGQR
jgi:hypothetical protein